MLCVKVEKKKKKKKFIKKAVDHRGNNSFDGNISGLIDISLNLKYPTVVNGFIANLKSTSYDSSDLWDCRLCQKPGAYSASVHNSPDNRLCLRKELAAL